MPSDTPEQEQLRQIERWRFFYGKGILPAGMSPRIDGEWVKFEDYQKALVEEREAGREHGRRMDKAHKEMHRWLDSVEDKDCEFCEALARLSSAPTETLDVGHRHKEKP